MIKVIKPPEKLPQTGKDNLVTRSLFLAGSIEQNCASLWQQTVENICNDKHLTLTIFNPRRDVWDANWKQDITNPLFVEQVNWELDALDMAEKIFMYFDPNTKSPISLLELGVYAKSAKIVVVCPDGFWRKGNVEIVCNRYNIPFYNDLQEGILEVLEEIHAKHSGLFKL
jgi:hypothetical protein